MAVSQGVPGRLVSSRVSNIELGWDGNCFAKGKCGKTSVSIRVSQPYVPNAEIRPYFSLFVHHPPASALAHSVSFVAPLRLARSLVAESGR